MFELIRKLKSAHKISLMDASNCHTDHGFNICVDLTGCYLGVESDVTGETVSPYKSVTSNLYLLAVSLRDDHTSPFFAQF